MKILIFTCNTGEGHNSAAKALLETAKVAGHDVELVDAMSLGKGSRTSKAVGGTYVWIVKHCPQVFHAMYELALKVSSNKHKSPVYYANSLLAEKMERFLGEHPCDIIMMTHLFPAEILTALKKKGRLKQKTIAVATDYTCIPFWEETDCDIYTVPHEEIVQEYLDRGVDENKLKPYGIPVSPQFQQKNSKKEACRHVGLPEEAKSYLIMGGSMGFGKIHLFAARLVRQCKNGEHIVIVCGHNQHLQKRLKLQFGHHSNVHVIGFTDQISQYMDACEVVFTKPGGLSSSEAAAKHIPIIHTAPIPGCESKNVAFFVHLGLSVKAAKMGEQLYYAKQLMYDEDRRSSMIQAQCTRFHEDAADHIVKLAEQMVLDQSV